MLQEAQRTSAPRAVSVSMRTAVWTVMWSDPAMRAPFSGCAAPYSSRRAMRPGISCSASGLVAAGLGEAQVGNLVVKGHAESIPYP